MKLKKKVEALIKLSTPVEGLIKEFVEATQNKTHGIESVAVLKKTDVINALNLCISGSISFDELTRWASILEANDLIDLEEDFSEYIGNILFLLASPEINEPLSIKYCSELLAQLQKSKIK